MDYIILHDSEFTSPHLCSIAFQQRNGANLNAGISQEVGELLLFPRTPLTVQLIPLPQLIHYRPLGRKAGSHLHLQGQHGYKLTEFRREREREREIYLILGLSKIFHV